jgi:hypothetical protein
MIQHNIHVNKKPRQTPQHFFFGMGSIFFRSSVVNTDDDEPRRKRAMTQTSPLVLVERDYPESKNCLSPPVEFYDPVHST